MHSIGMILLFIQLNYIIKGENRMWIVKYTVDNSVIDQNSSLCTLFVIIHSRLVPLIFLNTTIYYY